MYQMDKEGPLCFVRSYLPPQTAYYVPSGNPQGTGSYEEPGLLLGNFQSAFLEETQGKMAQEMLQAWKQRGAGEVAKKNAARSPLWTLNR